MIPDIKADGLCIVVGAGLVEEGEVRAFLEACERARSAVYRERRRLDLYEKRAESEATFRRCWGATVVDYDHRGTPILAALYPHRDLWPLGFNPATGQGVDLEFMRMPTSPWGPLWMRPSSRSAAHLWNGGGVFACGRELPLEYPGRRKMLTADAFRSCSRSPSLDGAVRCPKCEAAL